VRDRVGLIFRNALFTIFVPGLGAVGGPLWILYWRGSGSGHVTGWHWAAIALIAAGAALYLWCAYLFAAVGRGTPGPWDAPRTVVAAGPYRWVRNPIYLGALAVVLGEAALFGSLALVVYAAVMAACFAAFVLGYEEPTLRRRFGQSYAEYAAAVPRWIPRRPPHKRGDQRRS
jgi:protein-S-isoprenylcysteine O-methyltransferase Ste14